MAWPLTLPFLFSNPQEWKSTLKIRSKIAIFYQVLTTKSGRFAGPVITRLKGSQKTDPDAV
jgi:hypothetical protein